MKKAYSKPQIVFESFVLSRSIASGCEFISGNYSDASSCTFTDPKTKWNIFINSQCEIGSDTLEDGDICYHVSTEDRTIFNS